MLFLDFIDLQNGSIAQSVEQETENLRVGGSIPPRATITSFSTKFFLQKIHNQKYLFLFKTTKTQAFRV